MDTQQVNKQGIRNSLEAKVALSVRFDFGLPQNETEKQALHNKSAHDWKTVEWTLEQVAKHHASTGAICAGTFKGGHKTKSNFLQAQILKMDFDGKPDSEGRLPSPKNVLLDPFFAQHLGFIGESCSSTDAEPRLHGLIYLSRPVSAKEYEALQDRILARYPHLCATQKDCNRYFIGCKNGVYRPEAEPLDVDAFLADEHENLSAAPAGMEQSQVNGQRIADWKPYRMDWIRSEVMPLLDRAAPVVKRTGRRELRHCLNPAMHNHGDKNPSFTISYDRDATIGIPQCSNGHKPTWDEIAELAGATGFKEWFKAHSAATRPATNGNKPHTNGSAPYQSDTLARDVNEPIAENITPFPASAPRLTDTGNAQRIVARHGANVRYVALRDKWLLWAGERWEYDDLGTIRQLAKETTRAMLKEAAETTDEKRSTAIAQHALKSQSRNRIQAMIELAQDEPGIPVKVAQLDANPWLMGVGNGTLDLRTGELKSQADRGDLVTKHTSVPFDDSATAPIFHAFLDRIMEGDSERIYYLQKAWGYTLTGDVSENVFFLCHGPGANGKTVLLETQSRLLGDYSKKARFDTFVRKAFEAGGPTSDIARLVGARYVYAVEANEGQRFNEALIKELTGGDKQTASFKYENEFEFYPTLKLWLAANHKPVIRGTDLGIWRRVHLIPFNVTIPKEEQDKQLDQKLRAELPGILAWAVRGCLAWQSEGLGAPSAVANATEAYRAEQDSVLQFVTESCYIGQTPTPTKASDLWSAYKNYCQESNIFPIGRNKFYERLVTINGITQGDFAGKQRAFFGVGLLSEHEA